MLPLMVLDILKEPEPEKADQESHVGQVEFKTPVTGGVGEVRQAAGHNDGRGRKDWAGDRNLGALTQVQYLKP